MYQFPRGANYKVAKRWQWKKLGGAHTQPLSRGVMQSPCICLPAHVSCRYFRKDLIRSNSLSLDDGHLGGTTNSSAMHFTTRKFFTACTQQENALVNRSTTGTRSLTALHMLHFTVPKTNTLKPILSESDNKWPQNQGRGFKYLSKIKLSSSFEHNSCFFKCTLSCTQN